MLKLAQVKPGVVSYGTLGSASLAHLAITMITNQTTIEMAHIPCNGGGPLIINAIGGHVPVAAAPCGIT